MEEDDDEAEPDTVTAPSSTSSCPHLYDFSSGISGNKSPSLLLDVSVMSSSSSGLSSNPLSIKASTPATHHLLESFVNVNVILESKFSVIPMLSVCVSGPQSPDIVDAEDSGLKI